MNISALQKERAKYQPKLPKSLVGAVKMIEGENMYKKLDESLGNVLGFKLSGEFTEEELKEMSEEISLTASDMGKIHLLLEFEELKKMPESMTMPGVHNFTSRFKEKFAYMACVADKKWQTWWNRFTRFFSYSAWVAPASLCPCHQTKPAIS